MAFSWELPCGTPEAIGPPQGSYAERSEVSLPRNCHNYWHQKDALPRAAQHSFSCDFVL